MKFLTASLLGVFLTILCIGSNAENRPRNFIPSIPTTDENVEINVVHVTANIHMLKQKGGFGGNIAVFTGDDGVFLIDDQFAPYSKKIITAIRTISDKSIRFLINTHHHSDHVEGNEIFGNLGVLIVAHDKVRERLKNGVREMIMTKSFKTYPEAALPIVTFNDRVSFHLNGEKVDVIHLPPAHTDNDAIVHFTGSNVIHAGDVFRTEFYPIVDIYYGGTLDGIIHAHNVLIDLADPDTKIIPGHGVVTDRRTVIQARDMIITVRDRVKKLVMEGKSLEQVLAASPTAEFDERWQAPYDVVGKAGFLERYYRELTGDFQKQ